MQREQAADRLRRMVDHIEDAAGLHRHGHVDGIDIADAVEAGEREHQLARRHLPADQPGIAALRHDAHAGLVAGGDDEGDLRGRARAHHGRRGAVIEPALLDEIGRHVLRRGEDVVRADVLGDAVDEGGEVGHAGLMGSVWAW